MSHALNHRDAFSLLEVMAALIISVAATLVAISQWTSRADSAGDHSCTAMRAALQTAVDEFQLDNASLPSRIDRLSNSRYWDNAIPRCPSTDRQYSVRLGNVDCPVHGQTASR